MSRHAELVREILIACNRLPGVFLFPVDVTRTPSWKRTRGMTGTSDIIGWVEWCGVTECPSQRRPCSSTKSGSHVSRFVAIEVKVGRDVLRPEQRAFLDKVTAARGIALEVRDVMTAVNALR